MEYENTQAGLLNAHALPEWARWQQLTSRSGLELLPAGIFYALGVKTVAHGLHR